MLGEALFGGTTQTLEQALDVRMMRHQLISTNIANAETPGFRALDVDFDRTMQQLVGAQNGLGVTNEPVTVESALVVVTDDQTSVGADSNTVSLEKEIGKMQENKLMYEVVAQLLAQRLHMLSDTITNRGAG